MTDTLLGGASQACSSGDCEGAIRLLERAVRDHPASIDLYFRLGTCYGGSCRYHRLTNAGLATGYLECALRLASNEPVLTRAAILDVLASSLAGAGALPAALVCEGEAAALYREGGCLDDWARLEFNSGNICCELSEDGGENRWAQAIEHFQAALAVRSAGKDARKHAATLENMGTAYRQTNNPGEALRCYRRALRFAQPSQQAALHNNIGNVYLSCGRTANAIRHFDRAMALCGGDANPSLRAIIRHNRAQAKEVA